MLAFRELHPEGDNFLACPFVKESYLISRAGLEVRACAPEMIA
jgi:hypothetical protein